MQDLQLEQPIDELRRTSYNATILSIVEVSPGLRLFRIAPDRLPPPYQAGQYVPLGLGGWEPRYDGLQDDLSPQRKTRIISRPYSVSSPLVQSGRLYDPVGQRYLEFYIALAQTDGSPPRAGLLTSRLWNAQPGGRIFVGPRIAGRYMLDPVGIADNVLLLATGTGEAPHNAMVAELARRGHRGMVTALSTARYRKDFAYKRNHRQLVRIWKRYRYIALPTRQTVDGIKRHIQDVIGAPNMADWIGFPLDPDRTHVFLCGNPAMVGKVVWNGDTPLFTTPNGALEILHQRGFTLDRKGHSGGNVHFEKYW